MDLIVGAIRFLRFQVSMYDRIPSLRAYLTFIMDSHAIGIKMMTLIS